MVLVIVRLLGVSLAARIGATRVRIYLRKQLYPTQDRSDWSVLMLDDRLRDLEQEAWAGFLLTHERLWRALEAGLSRLGMSMAEYDVLVLLDLAGRDGMRMSDLAARRLMSTGGFTRLADRLERRELIERRRSDVDGRGFDAILTKGGRALLRKARRQHHQDLRELFLSRLDDEHLRCLARAWVRVDPRNDIWTHLSPVADAGPSQL